MFSIYITKWPHVWRAESEHQPVCPYVCSTSSVSEYVYLPPALSDSALLANLYIHTELGHLPCPYTDPVRLSVTLFGAL